MNAQILEWVGYIASVIIAISLALSSIVKFRWFNLVGALGFSIYGFLIGALPVGVLNGIIALVDIYYLVQIYGKKDVFETLEIRPENYYLIRFLEYHNDEIQKFFPGFEYKPDMNTVSFFILRNMAVAGLFLAHREEGNVLKVGLDYVIPEYRDFKNGKYVYLRLRDRFIKAGFTKVVTEGNSIEYIKYLEKLGFKEDENRMFSMDLV
ncbi:MAG TPA: hypothetical protein DIW31_04170 [Bacteroidales bacterium]|nr:hypothetical protein [Bacteroidales bacterium]